MLIFQDYEGEKFVQKKLKFIKNILRIFIIDLEIFDGKKEF